MKYREHGSFTERALLSLYGFLARRVDLHRGIFGAMYRHAYLFYKQIQDRALLKAARRWATPDTLVIDVGANIGFFSCAICRHTGTQAVAFEPDVKNFSQLAVVIASSGLIERVHTYCMALSDVTGIGKLYLSNLAPTDHKLINTRSSSSVDISTTTLDDFLDSHPEYEHKRVSLIKIDVQGAELRVLKGMRETLARQNRPPILVEYSPTDLYAAGATPRDFFEAFANLGYRPYLLSAEVPADPEWIIENTNVYANLLMRA